MSPSSAGRQRRSLPRSGSPSWGAFLFGQRAGAFVRTGRKFGDASGKIPTVAACGIPRKGSLPPGRARWRPVRSFGKNAGLAYRQGTYGGGSPTRKALRQEPGGDRSGASPLGLSATGPGREPAGPPFLSVPLRGRHKTLTGGRRPARRERSGSLPPGLAICGLLVYGSSFIEAHSGSGPGCPAMRYGAFFVVFRSWGRGRRQAGLQGLGRCGRSQPFWRIEKWLTSA